VNRLMSLTITGDVGIGDLIYAGGYWNRANHTINEYSEYVQYAQIQPNNTGYQSYAGWVQSFACETSSPSGTPGVADSFAGCNVPTMYTDYTDKTDRWSHELRLSSKPGGSTHWTAGLYWEQTRDIYSDFYAYPGINFNGQAGQTALSYYEGATPLPNEWYSYSNQRTDNHQFATFGEITQDLTKQWSVIVGLRYFKSHDSTSDDWSGYFYQPKEPTPTESVSFSKVTYKAGINYKYSDNALFYFSFAQGFRDGGFNTSAGPANPLVPATYQPDTLDSYEIGWKTVMDGGRFLFNGAAYYMPWKNYQTAVFDLAIDTVTFNANIGDARIYGVESNIEYRPIHGLTLSLAGNYNDSVLTSNAYNNPEFVVTSGQRLPFVPYFKGSASARYEMPLGPSFSTYAQFDISYTGDMWSDLNTSTLSSTGRSLQPSYTLSNIRCGLNNAKDSWGVEAYITNLSNTRAVIYTNKYNYDGRETTNEPRVFGLRLKYRFGGKTGGG
jgi:iron complex outermembrane recepter protein